MRERSKPAFTHEDVVKMSSTIEDLFDQIGNIFVQSLEPAPNSQASIEERQFPEPELVRDVYYRAYQSIEAAADHLVGFSSLLAAPAKTFAPFTCVRGLLESCAIAAWFLDPTVDVRTRVGRCYAFRYTGFVEQMKRAQAKNSKAELDSAKKRMTEVATKAQSLGYPIKRKDDGTISGIGEGWSGITNLIELTIQKGVAYRFLSAIAHGHHWATYTSSYRLVEVSNSKGITEKRLEKYVNSDLMYDLGNVAVTSMARVWWYFWKAYGWNSNELAAVLERTYADLKYKPELRFWHG